MFLTAAGTVVRSASDVKAAIECEWAVCRRLDAKLGRVAAVPDPEDALNRRAGALGDRHELAALEAFRQRFGRHERGRPGGVAEIERAGDAHDLAALEAGRLATVDALEAAADVVFQATFFDGVFLGYADFLVRGADGAWTVVDTKLARRARVPALLQVGAYAAALERLGLPVAPVAELLLGDGSTSLHRLTEIRPVLDRRTARLDALIAERLSDTRPIAWGAPDVRADGRCAECLAQVEEHRDVALVGRLRGDQRGRLVAAGVTTVDLLAERRDPVPGVSDAALARLAGQARLQLAAPRPTPAGRPTVLAEVHDPSGLAALPAPSPGDVFFDFEGDPLWTDGGASAVDPAAPAPATRPGELGLEYLFGVVDHDGEREHYRPFWAEDRPGEKRALQEFLAYLAERRRRHPDMHVYHYADYERSHLLQLSARHGVGEAELDALLTGHVFVDLYPVVTRSVRISDRSYGLKKLEPLYMGDELRTSDVTTGADSVEAYVRYTALRDGGETAAAEAQLRELAEYNRYDCVSTLRLRDWLLDAADAHGVPRRVDPGADDAGAREQAVAAAEARLRDRLLAEVEGVARPDRTPDQTAIALAAAAVEYHRREDKAFWWEHFNRQVTPPDEWADARDVLLVVRAVVAEDWSRDEGRRTDHRVLHLVGRLAPGSTLKVGANPYVMYDEPLPGRCDPVPSGQRGEHRASSVREVRDLPAGLVEVVLDEAAGDCAPWQDLPVALTPAAPFSTRRQRGAIDEWGERLAGMLPRMWADPALDLLRRRPPRLVGRGALPALDPADTAASITAATLALDRSTLAVQGPPGSGKTHVGARVVAALVREHGWRVGVVAQSHTVIENLLDRLVGAGLDGAVVGKKPARGDRSEREWTVLASPDEVRRFQQRRARNGFVLGGTAWDFANDETVGRKSLDLLVIDEAGQYSLANTIAVAVAAQRLLLLGDPQQLPQVTQGLHPEPVDESALGWLSAGHDVLPAELGYFLPRTWRMHPTLTRAVSRLSYEGRLGAQLPETAARALSGVAPGVHPVPVAHSGDTVESEAEAEAVVRLVADLIGRPWTDPAAGRDGDALRDADIVVVAPYNAQVDLIRRRLDDAGQGGVEVGTVDRFQGREAAVSIVSLTASNASDVPRGVGFVLLRNRLNVAVSRAKWAAFLVHSPALGDYLPVTAQGVSDLSAFLELTGSAESALVGR